MMEVPVWCTDRRMNWPDPKVFTRLNQLLDLTPLEPDEWHAVVAFHRIEHHCMSSTDYPFSYPDNPEFDFEDSQPRELYRLRKYLGADYYQRQIGKHYTSKC